jgi:hypothetical protein
LKYSAILESRRISIAMSEKEGDGDTPQPEGSEHEDSSLSQYPEVVTFEGVGNVSLLQIHLIALSVVVLGVILAYLAPPGGYFALAVFIAIAAGYDLIFIRKSQRPVRVSLYLQRNPVEASYGETKVGEVRTGAIVEDMEDPLELGFRPAPNKGLLVWKFDSEQDKNYVAKRLLEYLPLEK